MTLEKLTIHHEKDQQNNFVLLEPGAYFNPNQLVYSKSVTWAPSYTTGASKYRPGFEMLYQSSAPETLTLELFFDTYARGGAGGDLLGLLPSFGAGPGAESVVKATDAVASLAKQDIELHRPPVCRLSWGAFTLFQGVLQQASRTYLLFLDDGTPVRATMSCTFVEHPGRPLVSDEQHSPDVAKKHVVRPGDTLMGIAAALYGDRSAWRRIAEANRIDDPRRISPGQTLTIPRIR
ncbi:CIS tube protein [Sorangium sp. So ce204]|uniref:CIS tube protein n=1 Tax=Sorangium sp. So ce204 TaxID=3133288 RepID=UPI003F5E2D52